MNDIFSGVYDYEFFKFEKIEFKFHHILSILAVITVIAVLLWFIKRILNKSESSHIDKRRSKAIYQLFKYFFWSVGIVSCLEVIGIDVTIFIAGSAALLVGLGFGIQSIFNDIVSGIILLFEGTVSVEDVIEVDGLVGRVASIDLRTSKILTRDNIMIVVPNSKLISENVINWSHNREIARFDIKIGVAYGSDLALVKSILEQAASQHPEVSSTDDIDARFIDFGESSLDFELLFYSFEMFRIEKIKSDIRFEIDRAFREHGISIPFPQRDLHIVSGKL